MLRVLCLSRVLLGVSRVLRGLPTVSGVPMCVLRVMCLSRVLLGASRVLRGLPTVPGGPLCVSRVLRGLS